MGNNHGNSDCSVGLNNEKVRVPPAVEFREALWASVKCAP